MADLDTDVLRTVGPADAIANDFVFPYYLATASFGSRSRA